MKKISKPKQKWEFKPATLKQIEGQIEQILKMKTPMGDAFGDQWYRAREIRDLLRHQFNNRGMEFVSVAMTILKSRHPMARCSAAEEIGEFGATHSIYLQAEEPLLYTSKHDINPDVRKKAEDAAVHVNQKKLLDTIYGDHTPETKELTQELLNKATEIYCQHAWGRAPTEHELYDMKLQTVLRQIKEDRTFECRMGCKDICAGNMKLSITKKNDVFLFYVYENDYGAIKLYKKQNKMTARKIEEEWKQNGISVLQRADSGKS